LLSGEIVSNRYSHTPFRNKLSSWHTTAAIGRRFKQGQQIGHAEKLPELLTHVDEFKPAPSGF
jgi:hypothetical protein